MSDKSFYFECVQHKQTLLTEQTFFCRLLNDTFSIMTIWCWMMGKLIKWKEWDHGLIEVTSWHFPGGSEENHII